MIDPYYIVDLDVLIAERYGYLFLVDFLHNKTNHLIGILSYSLLAGQCASIGQFSYFARLQGFFLSHISRYIPIRTLVFSHFGSVHLDNFRTLTYIVNSIEVLVTVYDNLVINASTFNRSETRAYFWIDFEFYVCGKLCT